MSDHTLPGLSAKQIGYLRYVPVSTSEFRLPPSPPAKAMWNKLAIAGFVEATLVDRAAKYRMTAVGEAAIQRFDANLSPSIIAILRRIDAGDTKGIASMRGISTAIDADLVRILPRSLAYVLTNAGRAVLADL